MWKELAARIEKAVQELVEFWLRWVRDLLKMWGVN